MEDALAAVAGDLRGAVERLDELAFDALREAVAGGATDRPEVERRITRARNAVERAISLLEPKGRGAERRGAEDRGED